MSDLILNASWYLKNLLNTHSWINIFFLEVLLRYPKNFLDPNTNPLSGILPERFILLAIIEWIRI